MTTGTVACSRTVASRPRPAARHEQVDELVGGQQLDDRLAGVVADQLHRVLGNLVLAAQARAVIRSAIAALVCAAIDEPRSTAALPDFRQSAATSAVTFGLAS